MYEKNANYCYSHLSKKVCRNEAITTLQLGDIAFRKQLDEFYSVHIPTASGEGVSINGARVARVKLPVRYAIIFLGQTFVGERFPLTRNPFRNPLACI